MKLHLLLCASLFLTAIAPAADLPSIGVEHLYYLQSRADRIRKFTLDEMIEYCITQKIGGPGFDSLYSEVFALRLELVKLTRVEDLSVADARVAVVIKKIDAYSGLLREEANRVKNGITREGQIATDSLQAIAKAQRQQ